jgi:hypothetical protein
MKAFNPVIIATDFSIGVPSIAVASTIIVGVELHTWSRRTKA